MSFQILMLDNRGLLSTSDGFVYYVTNCCEASGKGSSDSSTGVVCRKCYQEVEAFYGYVGWFSNDLQVWKSWQRDQIQTSATLVNGSISFNNVNIMKSLTDKIIAEHATSEKIGV